MCVTMQARWRIEAVVVVMAVVAMRSMELQAQTARTQDTPVDISAEQPVVGGMAEIGEVVRWSGSVEEEGEDKEEKGELINAALVDSFNGIMEGEDNEEEESNRRCIELRCDTVLAERPFCGCMAESVVGVGAKCIDGEEKEEERESAVTKPQRSAEAKANIFGRGCRESDMEREKSQLPSSPLQSSCGMVGLRRSRL